jgi:hypothetical protein
VAVAEATPFGDGIEARLHQADAAPGTTATSRSAGREPVLISIHLAARLSRLPVLRIDGDIVLLDDDRLGTAVVNGRRGGVRGGTRRELPAGRRLALAEAELAAADDRKRRRSVS